MQGNPASEGDESDPFGPHFDLDLLRFTTAGSVDDGKSTLVGRLLYDTKSIFEDQLRAIKEASRRGTADAGSTPDLALLTDGLRAEREQGITIDVAYRYFATPRRKFIVADTPGHVQYTRNMVTGASTADLAVILVDAARGVQTQSKRHGFIASLLGIPHVVVAVNKIDLVSYRQDVYESIRQEYLAFSAKLDVKDITFIPVSALHGDNVVRTSERTPWYQGPTLLYHLEHVSVAQNRNFRDVRFPIQTVIRTDQAIRGFAGTVASGTLRKGDDVLALPAGTRSRVEAIMTFDGDLDEAAAGEAVVVRLKDEIDVSRGDMLVRPENLPTVGTGIDAMLCWMDQERLQTNRHYLLRHTTREVKAFVDCVVHRIDVDTLHREDASDLGLNDIGRVRLTTAAPVFFDPYQANRATGSFVLIDPYSNATVAAGMIRGASQSPDRVAGLASRLERQATRGARPTSPNVTWEGPSVAREDREKRQRHCGAIIWFTGLSGSGKTTIARELERQLFQAGVRTMLLDGDDVRHGLNGDLGFSPAERRENVRRIGEVARLFFESGAVTLCTFVSPYRNDRDLVRALVPAGRFLEVFVDVDLGTARQRDPKGLYAMAERGEIENMTGVSAPYEKPESPEVTIQTAVVSVEAAVRTLRRWLVDEGILPAELV